MEKKKKILLIIIPVIMICLVTGGITYAFYTASKSVEDKIVGVAAAPDIIVEVEEVTKRDSLLIPMSEDLISRAISHNPKCIDDNNNEVCDIYKITVTSNSEAAMYITGELNLVGDTLPNLKWRELASASSMKAEEVSYGLGRNEIFYNDVIHIGETKNYYVIVYINEINESQSDSGDFHGTVTVNGRTAEINNIVEQNATTYISNLYNDAPKSTITNNGITYNYASSVNLMNDRKGSGSIGIDSGNIRYYGGTPRNYIDIGDTHKSANMWETFPYLMAIETIYSSMYSDRSFKVNSAETCGMAIEAAATCTGYRIMGFDSQDQCLNNLSTLMLTLSEGNAATVEDFKAYYCRVSDYTSRWRIIGVFDGKLKLVRNLPIGVYSWDNKDTTTGAESNWGKNDWTTSRLMKLLNPSDYYTSDSNDNGYGQSLYWNSESGMCFKYDKNETCSCNFSAIGLTSEAKNKIAEVTWNLGGIREDKFPGYADSVYSFERGTATYNSSRLTSWTGKVGLVYPSDYLYANDFNKSDGCINKWTVDMEEEPIIPVNCYENIWIGSSNPDKILLTITPLSSTASDIVAGYKGFTLYTSAEDAISIYPVIYLKADSIIKSGSGRLDDPYVLA